MTDKQYAKQNMMHSTLSTCNKYKASFSGIPAFVAAVNELSKVHEQTIALSANQSSGRLQGASNQKNTCESELVNQVITVANAMYALASTTNNQALLLKSKISKSMLFLAHNHETLAMSKNIATEAAIQATQLADYGIRKEELTQLNHAIDEYERVIVLPRDTIVEAKQSTANLAALIALGDTILRDRMDKMMPQFKKKSPDFYAEYFNARNVINTSVRHRKNKEDEQPTV